VPRTLARVEVSGRADQQGSEPKGILGTVRNATLLLELLARGPAFQSVTALAEQSGLSIATAHRVLRSLAQAGLVRQSRRSLGYGLGPGLVRLSERYLGELPVIRALSPFLVELRNLTDATIEVNLLIQGQLVCVDRVDGVDRPGVFRQPRRPRRPVDTAAGRVLLGHAAPSENGNGDDGGDDDGEVDDRLRKEWAESAFVPFVPDGSHDLEVAVPVRSRSGVVVAALTAVATLADPTGVDDVAAQLARHLVRAAEAVSGAVDDE